MKEKCKDDIDQWIDIEGFTGVGSGDSHSWEEKETIIAKIQVLKCKECGRENSSWERIKI